MAKKPFDDSRSQNEKKAVKKKRNPHKISWTHKKSNPLDHSLEKNKVNASFFRSLKRFFSINSKVEEQTTKDKAFLKLKNWWPLSKISGRIFLIYIVTIIAGMILLAVPGVVLNHNYKWDFLTSLFTTSSAFSDTGINIADASNDYSFWGQLIIVLLIEMGGIGVLTFKVILYLMINRKISVNDASLAQSERGSSNLNSAVVMIRDGFLWLTAVQIIGAAILFFAFYFTVPDPNTNYIYNGERQVLELTSPYHNFVRSLWFCIFHSTSAINNAGFDIVSSGSLQPYNHSGNVSYLIQITFIVEWIIGGLGYPTFHDIKNKINAWRKGESVPFSLFTKLNFVIYLFLFFAGPLAIFGIEFSNRSNSLIFNNYTANTNPLGIIDAETIVITTSKPLGEVVMDIIFNTTSTRNAGFSSININDFSSGSKTVMGILMFIGSAPSSTAGGIRTTTLAIIILGIVSIARGKTRVSAFKKTVPEETVKRAFGVFFLSAVLVSLALVICYADSHAVLSIAYKGDEAVVGLFVLISSAFGTTGMNPLTSDQMYQLGVLTKLVIIVVMFMGQLGISNTLLVFAKNSSNEQFGYLEEEVVIG
ncbi:Ktr system potassium uptake protein B [Mesoplasma sp. JKS002658]|uniref:TrkH family potassium uptake protein n=1 Tax=Mesoplasma whartonense TaxID=2878854 RepID=UPI002022B5F6|nr:MULTISPECIES: potassium transporter TrkG [unclassified Mesoplasma]MCL8211676.1 Ktr system potassium uptake protein B [Mesoplasma sp. JKS002664]MCL8212053.1 Ktr system potassium uptake protein B [Mesoplasma sp. JKS002662]MCL8212678.1 Ktr system potassium uptake protein B [Mesoplasma sp. JKS002661]MCL8213708.1 Ktr system potassium uptake protein B [Mesoplasma sp. JKS002660]MCL8213842.1 Ktr system potassium uptake protein B [Mesoplasma sp. JKS002658]